MCTATVSSILQTSSRMTLKVREWTLKKGGGGGGGSGTVRGFQSAKLRHKPSGGIELRALMIFNAC